VLRPAPESPIAKLMVQGVEGRVIISHVRYATAGGLSYVNTHPFIKRFLGKDWAFAHNGDVSRFFRRFGRPRRCAVVGETDSEAAFCRIIEEVGRAGGVRDLVVRVWGVAAELSRYGKFNFLLSDGDYLIAHMSEPGTLHYVLRHPPHRGVVRLVDEDFEVRLEEMKAPDEYAAVIATYPLTDEDWEPMEVGTLYVFTSGDLLLQVTEGEPRLVLSEDEKAVLAAIRGSPRSAALERIAKEVGAPIEEVYRVVARLRNKGLVRQHSRDVVPPNHPRARYFTNPDIRDLINDAIAS